MFIPRAFLSLSLALTSLVGTVNPHPMAFQTAKDAAVVAIPDTPAGRQMTGWLKALNSGDPKMMRAFHAGAGERADRRAQQDARFYNQGHGLELRKIELSTDDEIVVLAQARLTEAWYRVSIKSGTDAQPQISVRGAANPSPRKMDEVELVKALEAYIKKLVAADAFSGTVLVAKNGKPIFTGAYGLASVAYKAPNRLDTKFNLGSMNKMFTAVAVCQLAEQGKLAFTDTIGKHLTDYPNKTVAEKVTIENLLTHSSGIGDYFNQKFMEASRDRFRRIKDYIPLFVDKPLEFEPGTKFNYSGEGFEYLRLAIENKFHKSLARLSDSLLFKPLHMTNTSHEWDGKKDFSKYSGMYDAEGKEILKDNYSVQASAAAGLTTDVNDMAKFAIEVLNSAHLSDKLYQEMISKQVNINPNLDQGLGWRVINGLPGNEYALQHAGNDPGVASIIVLLPKSKRAVVVMTNADNGLIMCNNIVRAAFPVGSQIIYKAYKSAPMSEQPKSISLAAEILNSRTGTFKRADGAIVKVSLKDRQLVLRMSGIPDLYLVPESEDKFYLLDLDAKVFFTKNGNGAIASVSIQDGGNVIKCDKVVN